MWESDYAWQAVSSRVPNLVRISDEGQTDAADAADRPDQAWERFGSERNEMMVDGRNPEVGVQIMYEGEEIAYQRMDLIVDDKLVIETKSSSYDLRKGARRQVYNCLRATNLEVGLLFHFGPEPKLYRTICRNTMNRSVQSEEIRLKSSS
jgi:GxxExxY protein